MTKLDERLRETHDRSEQALENVHRNISSIVGRLDDTDSLTNDALVGSIARTETSLTEMVNRVATIETQENSAVADLEGRLTDVCDQLDRARSDQQSTLEDIKASLEGLAERMTSLEKSAEESAALATVPVVEEAIEAVEEVEPELADSEDPLELEQDEPETGTEQSKPAGAMFDRSEFEELLLGKDRTEIEAAGETDETDEPAALYEPVEGTEGWAETVLKRADDLDSDSDEAEAEETDLEIDTLDLSESDDEEEDAPKPFSISDKLQELRGAPLSQSPEDEEHFRGSLRELVTRDEDYKNRRPYFWVAGGLIVLTMVLIGVVFLTGRGKELAVSGEQPSIIDSAKSYISGLVSGSDDIAPDAGSRELPVVDTETPALSTSEADESLAEDPFLDADSTVIEGGIEDGAEGEDLSEISLGSPTSSFLQAAELDVTAGLMQAAESGDAKAQYALGLAFSNGTNFSIDETSATRWYQAAADQGLAVAQYTMGSRFERGIGTPGDGAQAVDWYIKAAIGGNRKAMHNLAVAYATGEFVEQDLAGAARWFQEAAELGLADAQFNLGLLYERGIGVEESQVQAFKWFSVAALNGDATAQQRAKALEAELTDDDRQFVKLFVETWRPREPDPIANGEFDFSPAAYTSGGKRIEISHVQNMLVGLGFNLASVDGVGDPTTQKAIREYQELLGMPITGEISDELIGRLEASSN